MAQSTTDYKQFKIMSGNRKIVKFHVENLGRSMALYPEIFKLKPILVNKHMEVIDGQHRLAAAKKLGVPVWYDKVDNAGANEAIIINNNQRNWSIDDYARSFAAFGKQPYKDFIKLHEEHPHIPVYTIMRYIGGANSNAPKFRVGEFETPILEIGKVFLEQLDELSELAPRIVQTHPSRAMFQVFQTSGFNFDRLLSKMNQVNPVMLKLYGKTEEIIRAVEDIYNFRQQKDIVRFY